MKDAYRIGMLEKGQWQEYGSRLLKALTNEFKSGKEWEVVPSVLILFGWTMLIRSGVDKDAIMKMVDAFVAEVDRLYREKQN